MILVVPNNRVNSSARRVLNGEKDKKIMKKSEYIEFQQIFDAFLEREGISGFIGESKDQETYYSTNPCECCGNPYSGRRHKVTACNRKEDTLVEYEVCTNCLNYAENGQLDDESMMCMEDDI